MEKETTIYDIARLLKLSPATVSRALNDHPAINSQTKEIINTKARELGYRSNRFASNLRQQRTNTLGVILPRLNSNFMATVVSGMEKVASEAGYNLIISQSQELMKKEQANARTMFDGRVDGLLVSLASDTDNLDHFEPFSRKNIPVLFFDRVTAQNQFTNVVIDNVRAGYEATAHLIEQGCRRIVHLTGDLRRNVYADRLKGYQSALADHTIKVDDSLVRVTDLSIEAGAETARVIMDMNPRPDSLFVTNDMCAASCIGMLKSAGLRIPDDIAIVGFNNDPVSLVVEPHLTTINYPGREMGEIAVQTLINHLNGRMNMYQTSTISLHSELIVRESSVRHAPR